MSDVNRQSRWLLIVIGVPTVIAVIILILVTVAPIVHSKKWSGRKQLPVQVLVLDAGSLQPIVGAEVVLFNGPHSPLEGPITNYTPSDFLPQHKDADPQNANTDIDGRAVISRRFSAAGSDSPSKHTGFVFTSGVWVRVSARNYASITLPLDGQSVRPRDIDND